MACSRDTRVGCVRAQLASSLGCPFWSPHPLMPPAATGPWKLGRPSPHPQWPLHLPDPQCMGTAPGRLVLTVQGKVPRPDSRGPLGGEQVEGQGFSGEKTQPAYVLIPRTSKTCSL